MDTTSTRWTHLHVHSEHSPFDGLVKFKAALQKVKDDGGNAIAVTDHGNGSGWWKFAKIAREEGVKPIIGIEAYFAVADDWRNEPSRHAPGSQETARDDESDMELDTEGGKSSTKTKRNHHLTLLAENRIGYDNLVKMINAANNSFYGKPLMDFELLREHADGIIVLTGCLGGPVLGPVSRGEYEQAELNLNRLINAVGKDNVYVEVMEHGIPQETEALPKMAALAEKYDLPLVATNDAHYTHEKDAITHAAWLVIPSITKGVNLNDPRRYQFHGHGYHLRTEEEMRALRPEAWWQEAIDNAGIVAARCQDVVPPAEQRLPEFDLPEGFDTNREYLLHLVGLGVEKLFPNGENAAAVQDRITEELAVIEGKGFIDYFLIVHDVINWARSNGIRVGPGRGSAAGSLISYCLGIVQVDPLENNLLFERFLEPDREGMPDIDVDFQQNRRVEVLEYLAQRWGRARVARIGSFAAHKTRRALRDAAALLGVRQIGDQLSKAVPIGGGGQPYSFDKLLDESDPATERFRGILAKAGDDGMKVLDLAGGFADTINSESIHACGTLIADTDLTELIPLRKDRSKAGMNGLNLVTQWDGVDIDAFGLLKLDVLGLRNLDIVSKAVEYIQATTGEFIDTDLIPHPNTKGDARVEKAWELIRAGRTAGVFQMESSGMAKLAVQVEPETLGDLSAILALYRPGPMGADMHTLYAERKAGRSEVDYGMYTRNLDEQKAIASVLGETYGVFVFQEQLMRLGAVIAGFNASQRSLLRKAVAKKKKDVMEKVGALLIEGAPKEFRDETGEVTSIAFAPETALRMYDYMKKSAEYLFNASHSAAYAYLSYITAYLKANWPAEYGAAILATTSSDEKRGLALRALNEEGITVLAPDVNISRGETFPIGSDTIIIGLSEIKGVGVTGTQIAEYRDQYGEFTSLHQLMTIADKETGKAIVDTGVIDGLIESGALDAFGHRLGLSRIARASKAFSIPVPADQWGVLEQAARQRARLGVIMGVHPLDDPSIRRQVEAWTVNGDGRSSGAADLSNISDIDKNSFMAFGLVSDWTAKAYRGGTMVNFGIENGQTAYRGVLWNTTYKELEASAGGQPEPGQIVVMSGRVTVNEREILDEDDKVIEVEKTTELMASKVWHVAVNDPNTGATKAEPIQWGTKLTVIDSLIAAADRLAAEHAAELAVQLADQAGAAPAADGAPQAHALDDMSFDADPLLDIVAPAIKDASVAAAKADTAGQDGTAVFVAALDEIGDELHRADLAKQDAETAAAAVQAALPTDANVIEVRDTDPATLPVVVVQPEKSTPMIAASDAMTTKLFREKFTKADVDGKPGPSDTAPGAFIVRERGKPLFVAVYVDNRVRVNLKAVATPAPVTIREPIPAWWRFIGLEDHPFPPTRQEQITAMINDLDFD